MRKKDKTRQKEGMKRESKREREKVLRQAESERREREVNGDKLRR